jgi:hypothetical protein
MGLAVVPVTSQPSRAVVRGGLAGSGPGRQPADEHTIFLPWVARDSWAHLETPFGVQIYGTDPVEADSIAEMRGRWLRIPLSWSSVEPENTTPDGYQWPTEFELGLARLSGNGARIILTITGNPSWAASYPGGPVDKVDISELVEFVEAAVARYSRGPYSVKHWEFYNEPDNGSALYADWGFGYFGHDPAAYVWMLSRVYLPIKAVDPEAQVLMGGLSYDNWEEEDGGPFVKDFLDQVLSFGGGSYFDVMNFHYYPMSFRSRWDPYGPGLIGKTTFLREKLADYGVYKPLVCTETTVVSDIENGYELQSRAVPQLFAQGMAAELDLVVWFMLVDDKPTGYWQAGLLFYDRTPKPAYYAYQVMTEQLGPADFVRTLSLAETGSDQVEAYQFATLDGVTWVIVAWANDDHVHPLTLETPQLIMVDKHGMEAVLSDADDGVVDGRVRVPIGPSPVYLRFAAPSQGQSPASYDVQGSGRPL